MLPIKRHGRALVAATATALLLATAPAAMGQPNSLNGSINPNKGPIGSPLRLTIGFRLDADPGKEAGTLSKVDLFFPPNARTNGALFPSCSPETINARRSFAGCPKGSKIGTGRIRADVPAADVLDVPATMTIFNGRGGKSVTIHIYAENPVLISEAFTAPLTKTSGRFGYHLVAPIPPSLQEIADGWFAQVRTLTSTISGWARNRSGRRIPYIQSTTLCPKSLSVPIASRIAFLRDYAPISQSATIACRR
ncbi:hypothetical protein [Conexibacter sp. CPCC 206217]|uniref:hypothetical protein n=1 Tax=Conexibacter sp. CPCC 206217 TaxID=3064574 RepID=UPI002724C35C|nr:hypothetical protein [Conexibacter sp. CPCC 206217]MDO8209264.1 hypothetical protein [Conexibacter sp. CPCC 206217]